MSDVDNDHDRETDEWIVPADLRAKGPASNSGPPSASQEHAQAALRTGRPPSDLRAVQALSRDGGEKP